YGNQPVIAEWNLARFAESLLPAIMQPAEEQLMSQDDAVTKATESVVDFRTTYSAAWTDGFGKRLGVSADDAATLGPKLLEHLAASNTDFTTFFASLEQTGKKRGEIGITRRQMFQKLRPQCCGVVSRYS